MLLIIASLLLWGAGDFFRATRSDVVFSIGNYSMSVNEFANKLNQYTKRVEMDWGTALTAEQIRMFGVDQIVLRREILMAALDLEGENLRISPSEDEIREYIFSMNSFHDVLGNFDSDKYREVLRSVGQRDWEFESQVKKELVRSQIIEALFRGAIMPRYAFQELVKWQHETRDIMYARWLPSSITNNISVSDDEIRSFYDNNKDMFKTRETRDVRYLEVKSENIAIDEPVSHEVLKSIYDMSAERFLMPSYREVDHLIFPDESSADAAYLSLQEGRNSMESIADEIGMSAVDISLGVLYGDDLPEAMRQYLFEASKPGILPPFHTGVGWAIYNIRDLGQEKKIGFEEVIDILRREEETRIRQKLLDEAHSDMTDMIIADFPLEDISGQWGIEIRKLQVTRDGIVNSATAEQPHEVLGIPSAIEAIFSLEPNIVSDVFKLGDMLYVFEVDNVYPESVAELENVYEEVNNTIIQQELQVAIEEMIAKSGEMYDSGKSFPDIVKLYGGELETVIRMPFNNSAEDIISDEVRESIFLASPREISFHNNINTDGLFMFVVNDVHAVDEISSEMDILINEAIKVGTDSLQDELLSMYGESLIRDYGGIKVFQDNVERALDLVY